MKTRTMYMHTLDGKPASYDERNGHYVYFVGGRNKAQLARSLRQIQREQQNAIAFAWSDPLQRQWADLKRYGYVLVEVPA